MGLGEAKEQFGKVGVLMGGPSSEREISLKSGQAVYAALCGLGIKAVAIDIKTDNKNDAGSLVRSHDIDCAFIALHGRFGEDGQIQEVLDSLGTPYTGSGIQASRLAMDKVVSREIFSRAGLFIPGYQELRKDSYGSGFRPAPGLKMPLVVKPATHGSSIGLSIIDKEPGLARAIESAFQFDDRIVIEEFIEGRELTVGILGQEALPAIEIVPKKRLFDYEAKYTPGLTEYIVPAKLEADISVRIKDTAFLAHKLLGCRGCSRVDLILNKNNLPYILEVNTIPGLTNTSLLPKAARIVGIEFG
ncbi:MAG: D-alanine--D-alanine ligase, partial [Candidatus Omnitrophica bacterium]|nr:D-alanine--D-alanine ligase [Candidatus Omnitrophota bacterium]